MNEKFNLIVCQIIVVFVSIFTVACAKMDGYCASIAVDAGASQSILNGVNAFGSGSFNFSTMNPAMLPALYDNINMNLYQTFGYDVNDAIDYGADNLTSWATGQRDNPLNGASTISVSTADWLASKLLQAGATASSVLNTGYEYFAQSIPQWGENAKQFFIGKKNEVTGAIESAGANVVTKVTAEGLLAYNQIYNTLVGNGTVDNFNTFAPIYSNYFKYGVSKNFHYCQLETSIPILYFTGKLGSSVAFLACVPDSYTYSDGYYDYRIDTTVNGYTVKNGNVTNFSYIKLYNSRIVYVGDVAYRIGIPRLGHTLLEFPNDIRFGYYPTDADISSLISGTSPTVSVSYNYSDSVLSSALENQLERLLGKYIDSLTLQRINDIVASIPIGQELVDGVSVPVAIPTQEVVDELTDVIDDAITDSATYEEVLDAYYEDAIDVPVPPNPEPVVPEYTGTLVPTPFPDDTFSPINGGIDSVFSMASLFEPIFYVFSAFNGLFSLWLVVPFVLLFGILIRLLK